MRLCIIGKYPPIEGGVSTSTYWLSRGLAERGHEIHVVTNADEVEDEYRLMLTADDAAAYQPEYPAVSGYVQVHAAERFRRRTMSHIPAANPFVTKLASLATDVVRHHGCEVVFAYYYEPYAVAAWLATRWTGTPLIVKHAGSDLERLFRSPGLATAYKEIVRSADAVVTRRDLMPRFLGMGVRPERLRHDIPFSLPTDVFHPGVEPLDAARLAPLVDPDAEAVRAEDANTAVVGVYGKIGESKGTWDLLAALGHLANDGLPFELHAMIGRAQGRLLADSLREAGLSSRTRVLPFLPHWKVPAFIRGCTAVCFLERDFPVTIHGPIVPREVLACGSCLVLSEEIAAKQPFGDQFEDRGNVILVEDPKDHATLAAALEAVVTDTAFARAVGARGHLDMSQGIEDFCGYVNGWEATFLQHTSEYHDRRALPDSSVPTGLDLVAPNLVAALRRRCPRIVEDLLDESSAEHAHSAGIRFCELAAARLAADGDALGDDASKLRDALRYQRAQLDFGMDRGNNGTPQFPFADSVDGTGASVDRLRPTRAASVTIEDFSYDVLPLLAAPADDRATDLSAVSLERVQVLFHRLANLAPCELRINEATAELVGRCDGTRTTDEIVEEMRNWFGVDAALREAVGQEVVAALHRLHDAGVIAFGAAA